MMSLSTIYRRTAALIGSGRYRDTWAAMRAIAGCAAGDDAIQVFVCRFLPIGDAYSRRDVVFALLSAAQWV